MTDSREPPDTSTTDPATRRLRWILGGITVLFFYGSFFLGVYLTFTPNQTAVLTFALTALPAIALALTFLKRSNSQEPRP